MRVFEDKYLCSFLCGCACLYLSDLLAYGYAVMMLNVLRSDITIKIQHASLPKSPSRVNEVHIVLSHMSYVQMK